MPGSILDRLTWIHALKQQYNLDHIPCMFVATKSDLDLAQQVSPIIELKIPVRLTLE